MFVNKQTTLEGEILDLENSSLRLFSCPSAVFAMEDGVPAVRAVPYQTIDSGEMIVVEETMFDVFYTDERFIFPVKESSSFQTDASYLLDSELLFYVRRMRYTSPDVVGSSSEETRLVELSMSGEYPQHPKRASTGELVEESVLSHLFEEHDVKRVNVVR